MRVKVEYVPEGEVLATKELDGGVRSYSYTIGGAVLKAAGEVYAYPKGDVRWVETEEVKTRAEKKDWEGWEFSISQDESDALIQEIWVREPEMISLEGDKMTGSEVQYIIWHSEVPKAEILGPIIFSGEIYEEIYDFSDSGKVTRISP